MSIQNKHNSFLHQELDTEKQSEELRAADQGIYKPAAVQVSIKGTLRDRQGEMGRLKCFKDLLQLQYSCHHPPVSCLAEGCPNTGTDTLDSTFFLLEPSKEVETKEKRTKYRMSER